MVTHADTSGARDAHVVADQSEVFAFLAEPSAYDPPPERVERIDTHGAVVFLAGERVYKVKRAVRFSFMDFSTLAKRKAICEREVEINRATAPELYLGVVPITRGEDGRLALGGDGEAVEWAVEMRRFVQADVLDEVARRGALETEVMRALAEHIVRFHEKAKLARDADGAAIIAEVVAQTVEAFEEAAEHLDQDDIARYRAAAEGQLERVRALLRARARAGFVRRCHGDMHLRNIVLLDGRPVLFDAIEFNEAIATIDLLYDLAFLLMDLWERGLEAHANLVLNRYLFLSNERAHLDGLAALPLFLACRAAIRSMVTFYRLPHLTGEERQGALAEARRYFASARVCLAPPPARLVGIGGLSGTGKTTLAAMLAPAIGAAPGAVHLRSDLERKAHFGVEETVRLDPSAYTPEVSEAVYGTLMDKAAQALRAGHSVVVDAVFAEPGERAALEQVAAGAGVAFDGIWLEAAPKTLMERVGARARDASDADARVVAKQLGYETGEIAWARVDASGEPERVRAAVVRRLGLGDT